MNEQIRVLIIGLGLIGSSFGQALKQSTQVHVLGYDVQEGIPDQAQELGVIDEACTSLENLENIDVVVLAVPVMAIGSVLQQIQYMVPELKVLTDVGSVKGEVVKAVTDVFGVVPGCFVPGHPIAGAEKSGVTAAQADLFRNHMLILTPLPESQPDAIELIRHLWSACGAEVVLMSVERHDEVLAATSHLPHLIAFSLVDTLTRESENHEIFKYAAGGFRDFSRIAASDPPMWHDIFMSNRDATLKILHRFQLDLELLENAIQHSDGDLLRTVFTRAKSARDYFTEILDQRQKKLP